MLFPGDGKMAFARLFVPDKYFANFESLDMEIKSRMDRKSLSVKDHMYAISILYLVWSGFDRDSIPLIQKDHLAPIGDVIYDPVQYKERSIPAPAMEFLRSYAAAPVFMSQSGISPYLVRNRMAIQVSSQAIINAVLNLNGKLEHHGSTFGITTISESGRFYRAYLQELDGVKFPVYRKHKRLTPLGMQMYEEIFDRKFSSVNAVTRYLELYESYLEYFYPEFLKSKFPPLR